MTSAYHPLANCLVERQNQSIELIMVQVLENAAHEWSFIIDGVLFSMQIRKQKLTGFSPFVLLYQREAVLPYGLDWNIIEYKDNVLLKDDESNGKKAILETFNKMNENEEVYF